VSIPPRDGGSAIAATGLPPGTTRGTPTANTSSRRGFRFYLAVLAVSALLMDGSLSTWSPEDDAEAPLRSSERPIHRLRLSGLRRATLGGTARLEAIRSLGSLEEEGCSLLLLAPQGIEVGLTVLAQSLSEQGYHYESINVETQAANPASLLSWYRRLIQVRHASEALRKGRLTMLSPGGGTQVLAFLRTAGKERVLVVHNLGSSEVEAGPYALPAKRAEPLLADAGAAAPTACWIRPPRPERIQEMRYR